MKAEAVALAAALQGQIVRRTEAMRHEALLATGLAKKMPKGVAMPPQWALRAAWAFYEAEYPGLMPKEGRALHAEQIGKIVGFSSTTGAVLSHPDSAVEQQPPELKVHREALAKLLERDLEQGRSIESQVARARLPAAVVADYNRGRAKGSDLVVDETGNLRDDGSIKAEVCFFLWLYWEQVAGLKSLSAVMEFLLQFQVRGLSQKNLERICWQIGLRLKSRGRPKILLRREPK